jgi:hypothetical protein
VEGQGKGVCEGSGQGKRVWWRVRARGGVCRVRARGCVKGQSNKARRCESGSSRVMHITFKTSSMGGCPARSAYPGRQGNSCHDPPLAVFHTFSHTFSPPALICWPRLPFLRRVPSLYLLWRSGMLGLWYYAAAFLLFWHHLPLPHTPTPHPQAPPTGTQGHTQPTGNTQPPTRPHPTHRQTPTCSTRRRMVSASLPVFCSPTMSMRRGERWYFLATLCTQVGSVALNSSVWRSEGTWGGVCSDWGSKQRDSSG